MKSRGKGVQSGISDIRTIAYSDNFGLVPTLSLYPIYIVLENFQIFSVFSHLPPQALSATMTHGLELGEVSQKAAYYKL